MGVALGDPGEGGGVADDLEAPGRERGVPEPTIRLDRSCLLDLLAQIPRRSLVTGLVPARASLAPRLAEASASPSLPSHVNRPGRGHG